MTINLLVLDCSITLDISFTFLLFIRFLLPLLTLFLWISQLDLITALFVLLWSFYIIILVVILHIRFLILIFLAFLFLHTLFISLLFAASSFKTSDELGYGKQEECDKYYNHENEVCLVHFLEVLNYLNQSILHGLFTRVYRLAIIDIGEEI